MTKENNPFMINVPLLVVMYLFHHVRIMVFNGLGISNKGWLIGDIIFTVIIIIFVNLAIYNQREKNEKI